MAGAASPAGGLRASLTRAAARLTTPVGYLGVLGGLQVVLLWVLRERYGIWLALTGSVGLFALLLLLRASEDHWRLKLWGISLLGLLTAIGPTLIGVMQRPRIGLTMEHDGLLQLESAVDRLLKGQPIYGVDWSNTPMAAFGWDLTPGSNPALHHLAYFPLTVLVGIPFRLLTDALGVPFDYRLVLVAFGVIGLIAIITPVARSPPASPRWPWRRSRPSCRSFSPTPAPSGRMSCSIPAAALRMPIPSPATGSATSSTRSTSSHAAPTAFPF